MELKAGDWIRYQSGRIALVTNVSGNRADYIGVADGQRFSGEADTSKLTKIDRPTNWPTYLNPPT